MTQTQTQTHRHAGAVARTRAHTRARTCTHGERAHVFPSPLPFKATACWQAFEMTDSGIPAEWMAEIDAI
eukprot:3968813-Alexandrium_andersonii.AAC.1